MPGICVYARLTGEHHVPTVDEGKGHRGSIRGGVQCLTGNTGTRGLPVHTRNSVVLDVCLPVAI